MKTVMQQPDAIKLFINAASYYRDRARWYDEKADALKKAEEQAWLAQPWYKRAFTGVDFFTGFREELQAQKYKKSAQYCEQQVSILQKLSSLSRVSLSQKDLEMLEHSSI